MSLNLLNILPFMDSSRARGFYVRNMTFTFVSIATAFFSAGYTGYTSQKDPSLYGNGRLAYRVIKTMFEFFYALVTAACALESYGPAKEWLRISFELATIEPYDRPSDKQVEANDEVGDLTLY